jgi:hypothetical protein
MTHNNLKAQTDADTFVRTVLAPAMAEAAEDGFGLELWQAIVSAIFADAAYFDAAAEPDNMVPKLLALAKAASVAKPVMDIFHFNRWQEVSFLADCPLCGAQIGRGTIIAGGTCPECGEWMPGTGNAMASSKTTAHRLPH